MRHTELEKVIPDPFRLLQALSHDLRNKISGILSASQYFQDASGALDKEHVAVLQSIEASGNSLIRLSDDLFEFSTVFGSLKLERQRTDVGKLIERIMLPYQSLAKSNGIQVDVAIEWRAPRLYLDSAKMSVALDKLMAEMIESCRPGTNIRVRMGVDAQDVSISISLEQSKLSGQSFWSVVRPVHQRPDQPVGNVASRMLGLSIANRIVRAHRGAIRIGSADEHTLTLRLPHSAKAQPRGKTRLRPTLRK